MTPSCTQCSQPILKRVSPRTKHPFCGSVCYGEWQQGRKFADQGKPSRAKLTCVVADCKEPHFGKGYCRAHYIKLAYTPPKKPTAFTTSKPHVCIQCGTEFIAHHESPKYCSSGCAGAHRKKPHIIKKGYKKLLIPTHPRADAKGYVFEHIVVAEAMIGRTIKEPEEVHHRDFNKLNNSPDNLVVCADHAEHMKYHAMPSGDSTE